MPVFFWTRQEYPEPDKNFRPPDLDGLFCQGSLFAQGRTPPQDVMVVLGEAMGLVADILQQP